MSTILSPLLFALFINDLPPHIKCKILLFADDLKIFYKISTLSDAIQLQQDIDKIFNWCARNNLQLNINKCFILSFTRRTHSTFQHFNYNINGTAINRINQIRDLGVMYDSKLTFENHINNIVLSSCKMLGFISRSLNKFKRLETYKILYNSYVRSLLEYCSVILSPYYNIHNESIERVQKKFTRMIFRKFHYPREEYNMRLIRLNLLSLEERRLISDEVNLYKIKAGIINVAGAHDFQPNKNRVTRFNRIFYLPFVTTNVEYHSPILRMHRQHMEVFANVNLNENNLNAFKRYTIHEIKLTQPHTVYEN